MDYNLYMYGGKRKRKKKLYKFKFSGESKGGGKNNKVLEKIRIQEKGVPVI